ncbi:MAG TPA: hypothetical protein VG872_12580 [Acidimicrobiia bacterium]|nr:hypothetical protein [Acidimicrobiia bacterium]
MLRRSVLAVLVLAGCTSQATPSTTSLAPEPTGPGRLAVVDSEGDIVVMEADGSDPVEVAVAGEEIGLAQPIWSPDGSRLSWAQVSGEGPAYAISDLEGEPTVVPLDQFPYYAFWSPAKDRVGTLRNGSSGVVFEMITLPSGEVELVEEDAPFYFSWSPTGERVAAHAGPERLLDLGVGSSDGPAGDTDDGYLAPQWIPDGVLHVSGGDLVLVSSDGSSRSLAEVAGLTTFVANRQGTKVAVQSISSGGGQSVALRETAAAVRPNVVTVIDLDSGEFTTAAESPAVGFFWSPDGERLLVLAPDESGAALVASVWGDGGLEQYSAYQPSPIQLRDLFPFFPQYAQSLSFWAADSSAFVLAGAIDGEQGIWVQTLGESAPELVSGGSWAVWSP